MDSNGALAQLQQQQASAQDPNAILAGQRQQLGVNAANDTVTGLRGAIDSTTKLLKQVAPSVMGRTANSLVTNAQSNRIIQNEQAPINQSLSDQSSKYSEANQDANKLESEAEQSSQGIYQGQQDKLSYLQNLYNTLYGREQDTAKAASEKASQQEQIREFNASLNKASSSGGGSSAGSSGSTKQDPAHTAYSQQRSDGGTNFQNSKGQAISARRYAQIKAIDFNQLLRSMASAGDKGAADVLRNGGSSKYYQALTWD